MDIVEGRRVGIERIVAHPCALSLDLAELARARGKDPSYPGKELLVHRRSLNPPWEDAVTMAVNAARALLSEQDRQDIELIVVGTESSPDFGKPIATYVHRFAGIQPHCRSFETKHACYGGTSALMMAAHWVATGLRPGKKALVITSDQSRMHLGRPWEYVLGAGAVAMLVSERPEVLELELADSGYWTHEIADTYRPTATAEVGHADGSLYCYLDALEGAYRDHRRKVGDFDFEQRFARSVYHTPFGGMAYRAHRSLLRQGRSMKPREIDEHFAHHSRPALRYTAELGGTYTSSTFLGLLGLIDSSEGLEPGDRISLFAYGSGSCAEFYSGRLGPRARERVAEGRLAEQLARRIPVSVPRYERIERWRHRHAESRDYTVSMEGLDEVYEQHYRGAGRLVLQGVRSFERQYALS